MLTLRPADTLPQSTLDGRCWWSSQWHGRVRDCSLIRRLAAGDVLTLLCPVSNAFSCSKCPEQTMTDLSCQSDPSASDQLPAAPDPSLESGPKTNVRYLVF